MPAAHDRNARRDDSHAGQDDVVLESMEDGVADAANACGSFAADPLDETRATRRKEVLATAMVRSRLATVAGFLSLFNLSFAAFKLTGPAVTTGFTSDTPAWSLLARAAVSAVVLVVVQSPLRLERRHVRFLEAALLCIEMLFMLTMQYLSTVDLIDHRHLIDAVAIQKNGVIRTLILMVCYGIFLSRSPAATARVVVTMAAALILCHAMVLHHADTVGLEIVRVAGHQFVMANALFLVMGVVLSTLAARVFHATDGEERRAGDVGPYRLLRMLDAGGTGRIYLARHEALGRPCALKFVRPGDENAVLRFDRAVRAAARLSHPNSVAIFDGGRTTDGTPYCVMEFLPGLCVADVVRQSGPLPPSRAVYIARQVCGALAEAHRLGVVHRDLSPANVFMAVLGGRCDVAKVLDFGAIADQETDPDHAPSTAGILVGTPEYVAPEQAVAGGVVDGRTDIYGLGALLFFMVTGRPPFERGTPAEVLRAHVSEPVPAPRELAPGVPADLEAVILRCLAKRPADRYPDARAVAAALGACGCAAEWDEARAEGWWLEQASANSSASSASDVGPVSGTLASDEHASPSA